MCGGFMWDVPAIDVARVASQQGDTQHVMGHQLRAAAQGGDPSILNQLCSREVYIICT